jgi:hypothetical protein
METQTFTKRKRCQGFGCPAFASPANSGLCSYHDYQFTSLGDTVKELPSLDDTFGETET